jgi:hypothetical protein
VFDGSGAERRKESSAPESRDATFTYYKGNITAARYYLNNILPGASNAAALIKSEENTVLTCPEESLVIS